jgi:hypothetical protein
MATRKQILAQAEQILSSTTITPIWAMVLLDAGLVPPQCLDEYHKIIWANDIIQNAKRQTTERNNKEEAKPAVCCCAACEDPIENVNFHEGVTEQQIKDFNQWCLELAKKD